MNQVVWTLKAGTRLGPWQIGEPIGAGGMGQVYKATHRTVERRVAAVKVMNPDRVGKSDYGDRFLEEISLVAEIDNPNVVRFYDADTTESGLIWMAMELLSGMALDKLLELRGRLEIPDALRILENVADGVYAAHSVGVIHRDLKPANIFITRDQIVKVTDFGIAKLVDVKIARKRMVRSTEKTRVLGTWAYMSPEHLRGLTLDYRSDIFALGVMAYEMLSGRHPFADADGSLPDRDTVGARILIMQAAPIDQHVASFPWEVWAVVKRAIATSPQDRFASMAEFKRHLRDVRIGYCLERNLPVDPLPSLGADLERSGRSPAPPQLSLVGALPRVERQPSTHLAAQASRALEHGSASPSPPSGVVAPGAPVIRNAEVTHAVPLSALVYTVPMAHVDKEALRRDHLARRAAAAVASPPTSAGASPAPAPVVPAPPTPPPQRQPLVRAEVRPKPAPSNLVNVGYLLAGAVVTMALAWIILPHPAKPAASATGIPSPTLPASTDVDAPSSTATAMPAPSAAVATEELAASARTAVPVPTTTQSPQQAQPARPPVVPSPNRPPAAPTVPQPAKTGRGPIFG